MSLMPFNSPVGPRLAAPAPDHTPAAPLPRVLMALRSTATPIPSRSFRTIQIPPRSSLNDPFSPSYFPPLPRHWPASRQRWPRRAVGSPFSLRSYWLLRNSAQNR